LEVPVIAPKPRPCRLAILTGMVCLGETVLQGASVMPEDRFALTDVFAADLVLPRGVAIAGQPAPPRAG
jgi:hypothetical protein